MGIRHEVRTEDGLEIIENLTARKAIKLHCWECMGWAVTEVRKCEVEECACWPFRTNDTPQDTV